MVDRLPRWQGERRGLKRESSQAEKLKKLTQVKK
jgi:hypothetical protein